MADNNNSHSNSGGIGFIGALQLAFIIMKLTKLIKWKWIWVLSPTWITASLIIISILIMARLIKR